MTERSVSIICCDASLMVSRQECRKCSMLDAMLSSGMREDEEGSVRFEQFRAEAVRAFLWHLTGDSRWGSRETCKMLCLSAYQIAHYMHEEEIMRKCALLWADTLDFHRWGQAYTFAIYRNEDELRQACVSFFLTFGGAISSEQCPCKAQCFVGYMQPLDSNSKSKDEDALPISNSTPNTDSLSVVCGACGKQRQYHLRSACLTCGTRPHDIHCMRGAQRHKMVGDIRFWVCSLMEQLPAQHDTHNDGEAVRTDNMNDDEQNVVCCFLRDFHATSPAWRYNWPAVLHECAAITGTGSKELNSLLSLVHSFS